MLLKVPKLYFLGDFGFELASIDIDVGSLSYWQGVALYGLPSLIFLVVYCVVALIFLILRFVGFIGYWNNTKYTLYGARHVRVSVGSALIICLVCGVFVISGEITNEMLMYKTVSTLDIIDETANVVVPKMQTEYPVMLNKSSMEAMRLYGIGIENPLVISRMISDLELTRGRSDTFRAVSIFVEIFLRESFIRVFAVIAVFLLLMIAISILFCIYPALLGYGVILFVLGFIIILFSSFQAVYFVFVADMCNGLETFLDRQAEVGPILTERTVTRAVGEMFSCPSNNSALFHISSTRSLVLNSILPETNQMLADLYGGFGGAYAVGYLTNSTSLPSVTRKNISAAFEIVSNVPSDYTNTSFLTRASDVTLLGSNATDLENKLSSMLRCEFISNAVASVHSKFCRSTIFSLAGMLFILFFWICLFTVLMFTCAQGFKKYRAKFFLGTFDEEARDNLIAEEDKMLDEDLEEDEDESEEKDASTIPAPPEDPEFPPLEPLRTDAEEIPKVGFEEMLPFDVEMLPVPAEIGVPEAVDGSQSSNSIDGSSGGDIEGGSSTNESSEEHEGRSHEIEPEVDGDTQDLINKIDMDGTKRRARRKIDRKTDSFVRETIDVEVRSSMVNLTDNLIDEVSSEDEDVVSSVRKKMVEREQSVLFMTFGTE